MRETLVDAGWGALVTLALSVIPGSSVIGGAVAAHRRGAGYRSGFAVGAVAGTLAALPLLVLFLPALFVAGLFGLGLPPGSPAYGVFLVLLAALFLGYTVGLSALGGLLGVWVTANTDWHLDPARWL